MKNLALLLLLLTILADAQPPHRLVVGSWNIENLGGQRTQSPEQLAVHLRLAGADIIALQEIHDTGPGLSNGSLEVALRELSREPGQSWTYRLHPNKPPRETERLCGVAWNQEVVEPVGEPLRIAIKDDPNDRYPIWHRHPQAMKFRVLGQSETDFVLISIHMKSNRRPKGEDDFFTRMQRALEARTLVAQLPAISEHFDGEQDIVIVGDTNCLDAAEPALESYRGAGLRDLNLLDFNTHAKGRAPFDRFFVPADQKEFRNSHQIVLSPTDRRNYEQRVSDHYLILTTLEVSPDDD
jgi:predicted extracellular nuclease